MMPRLLCIFLCVAVFTSFSLAAPAPVSVKKRGDGTHVVFLTGDWACSAGADVPFSKNLTTCSGSAFFGGMLFPTKASSLVVMQGAFVFIDGQYSAYASGSLPDRKAGLDAVGVFDLDTQRAFFIDYPTFRGKNPYAKIQRALGSPMSNKEFREHIRETVRVNSTESFQMFPTPQCSFTGLFNSSDGSETGTLKSKKCNSRMSLNLSNHYQLRALQGAKWYNVIISMVFLLQFVGSVMQMHSLNSRDKMGDVSAVFVAFLLYFTLCTLFFHLIATTPVLQLSAWFSITCLFILSCVVAYTAWIILIWNACRETRPVSLAIVDSIGIVVALYVAFFPWVVFAGMIAEMSALMLLFIFSTFIPQIVTNTRKNTSRVLDPQYILITCVSTLAVPLYFTAVPNVFFPIHTMNFGKAFLLVLWLGGQAVALLWQHKNIGSEQQGYIAISWWERHHPQPQPARCVPPESIYR